jgi:oligo-1,6-glucosidase
MKEDGTSFCSKKNLHSYLQEMNKEVLSKRRDVSSRGSRNDKKTALNFVDADRKELNMGYHFDGVSLGYAFQKNESKLSLVEFKRIYSDWDAVYDKKGMGNDLFGQSRPT